MTAEEDQLANVSKFMLEECLFMKNGRSNVWSVENILKRARPVGIGTLVAVLPRGLRVVANVANLRQEVMRARGLA